jgi:hypothetical protein
MRQRNGRTPPPGRRRLERPSQETGTAVGGLIREAIDIAYPGFETDREATAAKLLATSPIDVTDWDDVKEEVLSTYDRNLS